MPLLIDCYNVLHAEKPSSLAGLGEASLCGLLARSPWAKGGVTVVCDGRPKPHSPSPSEVGAVTLIFSGEVSGGVSGGMSGGGAGRSADDVLIELIDKDSAPRRLTVVSSDRAIQRAAGRRKARCWSSEAFLKRLAAAIERVGRFGGAGRSGSGPGTSGGGKPEVGQMPGDQVDRWLDLFGIDPVDGADGPSRSGGEPKKPQKDDFWEAFGKDLKDFEDEFGG